MSLLVTNQVIVDRKAAVIEAAAWRVATKRNADTCLALPMNFETERDAERAKTALERMGLVSEDAMRRVGEEAVIRIMGESLAW